MRHSFGSYHLALHEDAHPPLKAARQKGHIRFVVGIWPISRAISNVILAFLARS